MTRTEDRQQCTGVTKRGKQCKLLALRGETTCKKHGRELEPHSKLSDAAVKAITDSLRIGNYREVAIRAAGIHHTTFYRWLEVGEADQEAGRDTIHARLRTAVMEAEAEAETTAVQTLRTGMATDPKLAATFLERRYPSRWAPGRKLEVSGAGGGPVPVAAVNPFGMLNPADLSPEAREEIAQALERARDRETAAEQAAEDRGLPPGEAV